MSSSLLYRQFIDSNEACALCTVVASSGSTPRKVGAKMLVKKDGSEFGAISGTIGGGAIEHHIRKMAIEIIDHKKPRLISTSLRNELGMCCGGEMTVFIEPSEKKPRFICFGAGHIAQHLCPLAISVGFQVLLIDERKELLNHEAFHQVHLKSIDHSLFAIQALHLNDDDYALVSTHDHQLDQTIVESLIVFPLAYLGLVGSTRKALMSNKRLLAKGFSYQDIERLECPSGLDIAAATPAEIAISIIGQMIRIKNAHHSLHRLSSSGGQELAHGLSQSSPAHSP